MQKNSIFLITMILCSASMSAQTLFFKNLEGRVYSKDGDVAATHVLNTTTRRATITDENGFFTIPARINDTLVFSAVQFKRREIIVTSEELESKMLYVPLEDALTELDEIVVMPYNLTGDMTRDMRMLDTGPIVTASTLGLPNAYVKPMPRAEKKLNEATTGGGLIPLFPIINAISGRTKMLKKRIARNRKYERTERVRKMYADSLFRKELRIPEEKIEDFMYFCEVDSVFQATVDTHDRFKIWEYMDKRSVIYRKDNRLD